jgi:hypothetical protein
MTEQTATGESTLISEGFIAYGEVDTSEGRGGLRELGRFTTVEEAIARTRGEGVQGDSSDVSSYEVRLYDGGAVKTIETKLIARRYTPEKRYLVGWLDLREYADGTS